MSLSLQGHVKEAISRERGGIFCSTSKDGACTSPTVQGSGDVKSSKKWGVHLRMSYFGFKICKHIILIMKQGKHRHFGFVRHKFKSELVRPSPLVKVI